MVNGIFFYGYFDNLRNSEISLSLRLYQTHLQNPSNFWCFLWDKILKNSLNKFLVLNYTFLWPVFTFCNSLGICLFYLSFLDRWILRWSKFLLASLFYDMNWKKINLQRTPHISSKQLINFDIYLLLWYSLPQSK